MFTAVCSCGCQPFQLRLTILLLLGLLSVGMNSPTGRNVAHCSVRGDLRIDCIGDCKLNGYIIVYKDAIEMIIPN
jgi:hypothetical protein